MFGPELGRAAAAYMQGLFVVGLVVGIVLTVGGWALWHFVLSHIHWVWQ